MYEVAFKDAVKALIQTNERLVLEALWEAGVLKWEWDTGGRQVLIVTDHRYTYRNWIGVTNEAEE